MNNLRVDSLASNNHSLRPRATHSGTRRAPQQAFFDLSQRAGANAHQTQKPRAGCPARARQPSDRSRRPRQQADSTPGTDGPRGCPPVAAQVQISSPKSFLRLWLPARTRAWHKQPQKTRTTAGRRYAPSTASKHGDRLTPPCEPVPSDARTEKICRRDALRRARHVPLIPGE